MSEQAFVGFVRSDMNVELGLSLEVCQRGIANFVEGIRTVRDEFMKEDLLI